MRIKLSTLCAGAATAARQAQGMVKKPALTLLAVVGMGLLPASVMAVSAGDPAPDFRLPVLGFKAEGSKTGGTKAEQSLQDHRGQVVYLDFWASWCAPCRKSMPFMEALHQELASEGLRILAVNLDDEQAPALKFVERYGVTYTNLFDGMATLPEKYKVMGMPTAVLIDRKGVVRWVHAGFSSKDEAEIRQQIEAVLADPS